jgi:hypothetical protein
VRRPARERGGDRPSGKEFSAGLIFPLSCFASGHALIHQGVQGKFAKKKTQQLREKEMKPPKEALPNKSKLPPPYLVSSIPLPMN